MSDQLEQRLDSLGRSTVAGRAPAPPAGLVDALRRRRSQRSIQRVFIVGAASLVSAGAGITAVVVFSGPFRTPVHQEAPVVRDTPRQPVHEVLIWRPLDDPDRAPSPGSAPHVATPRDQIISAGSLYSRRVAESLLSSM